MNWCGRAGPRKSGYYAWRHRPLSARARADVELTAKIQVIHRESRGTYGAPRIRAELIAAAVPIGRKRVARLMRGAGVLGVSRRKAFTTTVRDEGARPAPDLVERQFTAAGPDRLWVVDITYVPTWAGFLFLAVVLDAWSRRIVGWAMDTHLRTDLVLAALDMALPQRRPTDVIHHSDQGCQYTSVAFGRRCREAGVRPSMGSVGDAYDNAMCESFFATLEEGVDTGTATGDLFLNVAGGHQPVGAAHHSRGHADRHGLPSGTGATSAPARLRSPEEWTETPHRRADVKRQAMSPAAGRDALPLRQCQCRRSSLARWRVPERH